jgi:hypothetical protein
MPPMRRLARHALTALSALSLLLCVASIAAWVLSRDKPRFTHDVVRRQHVHLSGQYGRLWVRWQTPYQRVVSSSRSRFVTRRRFALVVYVKTDNVVQGPDGFLGNVISDLYVPFWELAVAFALAPAAWALRRRSLARCRSPGLCPLCGYDLRASPGRCPECGAAAAAAADAPRAGG